MFTRKAACLAVVCAVLTVGSAAYGAFSADLYWGDEAGVQVANTLEIPEAQATIELVLWDNQVYGGAGADYIQWVNLNLSSSSAALNATTSWTWDAALLGQLTADASAPGILGRSDPAPDVLWRPVSPVRIGKLTINKPAYVEGGMNDYLLSLKGGAAGMDETFIAADFGAGGVAAPSVGNMPTQDLTIRVLPEPATIALLGIGAAMTFIRRRKHA